VSTPFVIEGEGFRLDCRRRTHVMGILNVTPDSFSDGGAFFDPDAAVAHGRQMAADGADIIDVGGESTRPGSEGVSPDEELRRVLPVVERLAGTLEVPVSIDTRKAEVARQAIRAGARIVNDVSGMTADPGMEGVVADAGVPVVLMHSKGTPKTMQQHPWYRDPIGEISAWLADRVQAARQSGIRPNRIIVDPGLGFGKRVSDNLLILKSLEAFHTLACPVLIGPSRKSFIGRVLDLGEQERIEGTAAAVALGIAHGAHLIRVHDVRTMVRVARMTDAILRATQENHGH
jgi:dihydropteroate synthase